MKANFGAFFLSTYRAFKTNLAPLLDESFLYKIGEPQSLTGDLNPKSWINKIRIPKKIAKLY